MHTLGCGLYKVYPEVIVIAKIANRGVELIDVVFQDETPHRFKGVVLVWEEVQNGVFGDEEDLVLQLQRLDVHVELYASNDGTSRTERALYLLERLLLLDQRRVEMAHHRARHPDQRFTTGKKEPRGLRRGTS